MKITAEALVEAAQRIADRSPTTATGERPTARLVLLNATIFGDARFFTLLVEAGNGFSRMDRNGPTVRKALRLAKNN